MTSLKWHLPLLLSSLLVGILSADDASPAVQQAGNNILTLTAAQATINGTSLFLEGDDEQDLGNWSNPSEYPSWAISLATPGRYRVEMAYSASSDCGTTNTVELTVGTQTIDFHPFPTGDWSHYRRVKIGEINLTDKGHMNVTLKCTKKTGGFIMNVRKIIFMPAESASLGDEMVPTITGIQGHAIVLTPLIAGVTGPAISLEGDGAFGSWSSTDTAIYWPVNFPAGHYRVSWNYSLDPSNVGTEIQLSVGNVQKLTAAPASTGDWTTYQTTDIGDVTIDKSGPLTVTMKATKQGASFVMNLKALTFTPDK